MLVFLKTRNSEVKASVCTNALLANVNGKTTIKCVQFAVSLLLTINLNVAKSPDTDIVVKTTLRAKHQKPFRMVGSKGHHIGDILRLADASQWKLLAQLFD
jgi:hypothetical protein